MSLREKTGSSTGALRWIRRAADVVFPGRCLVCGEWLYFQDEPGSPVCGGCRARLNPLSGARCAVCGIPLLSEDGICTRCRGTEYSFNRNLSVFAYAGEIKDLVHAYKFGKRSRLAGFFADFIAVVLEREFPGLPLVPAPPRPGGVRRDHVDGIADALARKHGAAVLRLLERTGGASQKTLDLEERRKNLQGRIRARRGAATPEKVILLDDIFTTGATADACAAALREAGCREVGVVTLAIEV
jgi:ComF family protein